MFPAWLFVPAPASRRFLIRLSRSTTEHALMTEIALSAPAIADATIRLSPRRRLEAELLAMPPVAALGLRIVEATGDRMRLHAPLAPNINDKGCAFGGSLSSIMTLAGWSLIVLRLAEAGLDADVFVADSEIRYRAPLYADLETTAELVDGQSWDVFLSTLRSRGRARLSVRSVVGLPEGGVATESLSRYAAKLRE
jgi:thioesterase domain-containing protein